MKVAHTHVPRLEPKAVKIATAIKKYGANLNDKFWVLFFVLIPDIIFINITKKYNTILTSVKPNPQK